MAAGGTITLDFDQWYAMENDYDYGYVEVRSIATSDTFYPVWTMSNPGFAGSPGSSQDWTSTHPDGGGHMVAALYTRRREDLHQDRR